MLDFTPLRFDSLERRPHESSEFEFIRDILRDKGTDWVVDAIKMRQRGEESSRKEIIQRIAKDRKDRQVGIDEDRSAYDVSRKYTDA